LVTKGTSLTDNGGNLADDNSCGFTNTTSVNNASNLNLVLIISTSASRTTSAGILQLPEAAGVYRGLS
jgi:hypothetical protein